MRVLSFAADLVLILHFCFVLGILVPIPLILIGAKRQWKWVRKSWLRKLHLTMMGIVILETLLGVVCPLTDWEQRLRESSGQSTYAGSFIAYWVSRILFYSFEPWVFIVMYLAVGGLILGLYVWVPPVSKEVWRLLTCPIPQCSQESALNPRDSRPYVTCPKCKVGHMANGRSHGRIIRVERGQLSYPRILE
jgi:hypothetical protein